jgi:anti-sigma regulatory factor (Ser/Thr protein kinase)
MAVGANDQEHSAPAHIPHSQSPSAWLREGRVNSWRRVFPGRLDQVAVARSWSGQLLAGTGRADDAVLVVTELVSNALLHTRSGQPHGWFGIELAWGRHARIAVHDLGADRTPLLALASVPVEELLGEHGRGLQLVRELAEDVGVDGSRESGHTVWALLALPAAPGAWPELIAWRRSVTRGSAAPCSPDR